MRGGRGGVYNRGMNAARIRARVEECRERIEAARSRAGRTEPVTLVAVTKTYPAALLAEAAAAGVADIGENRVGELEDKVAELGRDAFRWHLIGHLQRNKAQRAVGCFDLLHSLDSPPLARILSEHGETDGAPVRALVQVNCSGEESKSGIPLEGALDAIGAFCAHPGLRIEGLMTMAPLTDDPAVLQGTFRTARALWEEAARELPAFHALHLSMGMSNDYEIAVEEGSTLVRLGTALFGARDH